MFNNKEENKKFEFVTQTQQEANDNLLEKFYAEKLEPLVKEKEKLKEKYRGQFWCCLWSVFFLLAANTLIILFRVLMYKYPISYGQLLLVNVLAVIAVMFPIFRHRFLPKTDLVAIFLSFFGNWKHRKENKLLEIEAPIFPLHESVKGFRQIEINGIGAKILLQDVVFYDSAQVYKWKFKRTVSSGVSIGFELDKNFADEVYLFDVGGFYRKSKFNEMANIAADLMIPAAECFYIFCKDADFAKNILPSMFFDDVLDLKQIYQARNVYVYMAEKHMQVYLEGAVLHTEYDGLWQRSENEEDFMALRDKIEQTFMLLQVVQTMNND